MSTSLTDRPGIQILPSLLAADFARLGEECRRAETTGADGLHLDVMDGHFVPNISFGAEIVRVASRSCQLPLSVHLMVTRPDFYAKSFIEAGATLLLIQVESSCDIAATLRAIKAAGCRPGLVLNPETPAAAAEPFLEQVEEIMCMTVHPGFGGQAFIPQVLPKLQELRARRPRLDLSVDGGITVETAVRCAAAGVNVFIAGTSLYRAADMAGETRRMRDAVEKARPTS